MNVIEVKNQHSYLGGPTLYHRRDGRLMLFLLRDWRNHMKHIYIYICTVHMYTWMRIYVYIMYLWIQCACQLGRMLHLSDIQKYKNVIYIYVNYHILLVCYIYIHIKFYFISNIYVEYIYIYILDHTVYTISYSIYYIIYINKSYHVI